MKAKTIKVILIDPLARMVTEAVVENDLSAFYRILHCDIIEAVSSRGLVGTDHLYVDEEGLFKQEQSFFEIAGAQGGGQQIAGRALVLGLDDEGDSIDVATALATVQTRVRFI
jgi:hypothetical protein